jgi:signal recognition particle GTPase
MQVMSGFRRGAGAAGSILALKVFKTGAIFMAGMNGKGRTGTCTKQDD